MLRRVVTRGAQFRFHTLTRKSIYGFSAHAPGANRFAAAAVAGFDSGRCSDRSAGLAPLFLAVSGATAAISVTGGLAWCDGDKEACPSAESSSEDLRLLREEAELLTKVGRLECALSPV